MNELTPEQQAHLVAILKNHPKLNFITEGFPDPNIDDRDLVMAAATWLDLARNHVAKAGATSPDDIIDDGYEEKDPPIKQVKFDGLLRRGWHFIDPPEQLQNPTRESDLQAFKQAFEKGYATGFKTTHPQQ